MAVAAVKGKIYVVGDFGGERELEIMILLPTVEVAAPLFAWRTYAKVSSSSTMRITGTIGGLRAYRCGLVTATCEGERARHPNYLVRGDVPVLPDNAITGTEV